MASESPGIFEYAALQLLEEVSTRESELSAIVPAIKTILTDDIKPSVRISALETLRSWVDKRNVSITEKRRRNVQMSGWLRKVGTSKFTATKRWVVLDGQTLMYYEDESEMDLKGILHLNGCRCYHSKSISDPRKFVFTVTSNPLRASKVHKGTDPKLRRLRSSPQHRRVPTDAGSVLMPRLAEQITSPTSQAQRHMHSPSASGNIPGKFSQYNSTGHLAFDAITVSSFGSEETTETGTMAAADLAKRVLNPLHETKTKYRWAASSAEERDKWMNAIKCAASSPPIELEALKWSRALASAQNGVAYRRLLRRLCRSFTISSELVSNFKLEHPLGSIDMIGPSCVSPSHASSNFVRRLESGWLCMSADWVRTMMKASASLINNVTEPLPVTPINREKPNNTFLSRSRFKQLFRRKTENVSPVRTPVKAFASGTQRNLSSEPPAPPPLPVTPNQASSQASSGLKENSDSPHVAENHVNAASESESTSVATPVESMRIQRALDTSADLLSSPLSSLGGASPALSAIGALSDVYSDSDAVHVTDPAYHRNVRRTYQGVGQMHRTPIRVLHEESRLASMDGVPRTRKLNKRRSHLTQHVQEAVAVASAARFKRRMGYTPGERVNIRQLELDLGRDILDVNIVVRHPPHRDSAQSPRHERFVMSSYLPARVAMCERYEQCAANWLVVTLARRILSTIHTVDEWLHELNATKTLPSVDATDTRQSPSKGTCRFYTGANHTHNHSRVNNELRTKLYPTLNEIAAAQCIQTETLPKHVLQPNEEGDTFHLDEVEIGPMQGAWPSDDTPHLEARVLEFAREILLCSSRTVTGGDAYDAVELIFRNPDLLLLVPDSEAAPPVTLDIQLMLPKFSITPRSDLHTGRNVTTSKDSNSDYLASQKQALSYDRHEHTMNHAEHVLGLTNKFSQLGLVTPNNQENKTDDTTSTDTTVNSKPHAIDTGYKPHHRKSNSAETEHLTTSTNCVMKSGSSTDIKRPNHVASVENNSPISGSRSEPSTMLVGTKPHITMPPSKETLGIQLTRFDSPRHKLHESCGNSYVSHVRQSYFLETHAKPHLFVSLRSGMYYRVKSLDPEDEPAIEEEEEQQQQEDDVHSRSDEHGGLSPFASPRLRPMDHQDNTVSPKRLDTSQTYRKSSFQMDAPNSAVGTTNEAFESHKPRRRRRSSSYNPTTTHTATKGFDTFSDQSEDTNGTLKSTNKPRTQLEHQTMTFTQENNRIHFEEIGNFSSSREGWTPSDSPTHLPGIQVITNSDPPQNQKHDHDHTPGGTSWRQGDWAYISAIFNRRFRWGAPPDPAHVALRVHPRKANKRIGQDEGSNLEG